MTESDFFRASSFESGGPHGLAILPDRRARLQNVHDHELYLVAQQQYAVVRTPDNPRRWKVRTLKYVYELVDSQNRRILGYHWHPDDVSWVGWAHLHIGHTSPASGADTPPPIDVRQAHLPTGRIALEEFLLVLIQEMGILPVRSDWYATLHQSLALFRQSRSWASSPTESL